MKLIYLFKIKVENDYKYVMNELTKWQCLILKFHNAWPFIYLCKCVAYRLANKLFSLFYQRNNLWIFRPESRVMLNGYLIRIVHLVAARICYELDFVYLFLKNRLARSTTNFFLFLQKTDFWKISLPVIIKFVFFISSLRHKQF